MARYGVQAIVLLVLGVGCGGGALGVQWAKSLGLSRLDRAGALRDAEDRYGFGELALADAVVLPTTCNERERLRKQGYTPTNTVEGQNDDAANVRCNTLALLTRAHPARTSYVRALRWDASLLALLPAAFGSRIDPEHRAAADRASASGLSLAALDPKARAKPGSTPGSLVIEEGDGNGSILLYAQAWGDFNADGLDDFVVSVTNADTRGPYSEVRLVLLTRGNADERLRILETY
jgi:hypothetical protein